MSGVSSVVIKIGAETASAVSSIKNVDRALGEAQTRGQKMQGAIKDAAIPAAAALGVLTAAGIASAKAAAEDQQSRQQLDSQLQRSLGSTKEATAANEEWVNSLSQSVAVANEDLRPALAGAVRATGDLTKAHTLLKTALDVSAATGKPLASVTAALGKAYNGSTGALKKLAPSISDATLKSGDYAKIQGELNKQFGGAAKGQAATAAGQYKKMQIAMHELQVEIGNALLPAIQALIPFVSTLVGIFAAHSGVILAVAGAVAAFSGAILIANAALGAYETIQTIATTVAEIWNSTLVQSTARTVAQTVATVAYGVEQLAVSAATKVWAAAQWLLNAALDANPIGLAIIAVAALTAGIVLAYRHSATFRNIVQSAFAIAKQNAVLLLGPIGLIIRAFMLLYQNSGTVRAGVTASLHAIGDAIGVVQRAFGHLLDSAGRVKGVLVSAFNAVVDAINSLVSAVEGLIGQIGRIHFPSKPSWIPFSVPASSSVTSGGAARSSSSGPVVNVNISGAIDPEATALAIRRVLTRYDRRRGRSPLGGAGGGLSAA